MLKKILLGAVFAGLAGFLVLGAINRTLAINGEAAKDGSASRIQEAFSGDQQSGRALGRMQSWETSPAPTGAPALAPETGDSRLLQGLVTDIGPDALSLQLENGEMLALEGRSWSYAGEQGFLPQIGDRLRVSGFYDSSGRFEIAQLENLTSGASLSLQETNGRPVWAAAGRGQGRGRAR